MCWCKNPPACILRRQSRRYYRVVGRGARVWWAEIALAMALAGWIAYALTAQPQEPSVGIDWHGQQTCVFSGAEFGSKLGNLCSRLDPATHWALRQRI